jgi:acylphosphatase
VSVVARRVVVRGRVQGVFFRDSTREQAQRRGVAGWVRNRADGTVEARFEGPEEAVRALVDWCRTGPPWADVLDLDVEECPPEGLGAFSVR